MDSEGIFFFQEFFLQTDSIRRLDYAAGDIVAVIIRDLNARQYRTSRGKEFNKNSINRILHNRRYIGYYIYKGEETAGGMPRIIDDALFEQVQAILEANKKPRGEPRAKWNISSQQNYFVATVKNL